MAESADEKLAAGGPNTGTPRVSNEDHQLMESVARLSELTVGEMSLDDLLQQIATFAASVVPGADGVGLGLQDGDRIETAVSTNEFVAEVDKLQYSLGQGPCVTAARGGVTVDSGSVADDRRWPDFGSRAASMGVHSALSLPLATSERVVGVFNFYAHSRQAFGRRSVAVAELFAIPAAIAVHEAQSWFRVKDLASQLQTELTSNEHMDETIGKLISRYRLSADDLLRRSRAIRRPRS